MFWYSDIEQLIALTLLDEGSSHGSDDGHFELSSVILGLLELGLT